MSCCDCICLTASSTAAAPPQLCTAIQEYTRQTATALKTTTLSSACACRHRAAWTARPLAHGALRQHGMRQMAREQRTGRSTGVSGGRWSAVWYARLEAGAHPTCCRSLAYTFIPRVLGRFRKQFYQFHISCVNYTGHGHGRATLTKGVGVSQWTHAAGCIP
jgi:hypothetical protein